MLFPSLMFLRRVPIQEYRRRKLRYLLLLFLRCLGLLLLVAAFASPVTHLAWFGAVSGQVSRSLVVLLDNSMSMARPGVWERALEKARVKFRSMQGTDQACLILFASKPNVLSAWESRSGRLLQILESRAEPSFREHLVSGGSACGGPTVRSGGDGTPGDLPDHRSSADGHALGPGVGAGWGRASGGGGRGRTLHQRLHPGGGPATARLLRAVSPAGPGSASLAPPGPARGELQLFVEGQMLDRQTFELDQEGSAPVTLRPFELKEGIFRGRLVLAVADAMEADNVFHFVVERTSPGRIRVYSDQGGRLHLSEECPEGRPQPALRDRIRGLARNRATGSGTGPRRHSGRPEDASPLRPAEPLPGGGRRSHPGPGQAGRRQSVQSHRDLPCPVGRTPIPPGPRPVFTSITEMDWSHPAFAIFQDLQRTALASVRFYGHWRLEPREGSRVLGRFDEGDPALVEGQAGAGRVLVLAFPLDRVWSDFPLRPAFLPFWQSLVRHMGGVRQPEAALRVDQSLAFQEEPPGPEPAIAHDGTCWIPEAGEWWIWTSPRRLP